MTIEIDGKVHKVEFNGIHGMRIGHDNWINGTIETEDGIQSVCVTLSRFESAKFAAHITGAK